MKRILGLNFGPLLKKTLHTAVYLPIAKESKFRFLQESKKVMADKKGRDMELHKAFMELQTKMLDSKQKMKMADMQIENLKRSITHTELTSSELKSLPQNTRLYESVGRMFILSSGPEVTNTLDTKKENSKEKIKNLEANKTYLERSLKDSENSLRELVAQRRAQ